MKKFILLFLVSLPLILCGKSYTYLIGKYTKVTELEAKIVIKIAQDMLPDQKINLYIPNSKDIDKQIYSKNIHLVKTCAQANFIFAKYGDAAQCKNSKNQGYILTNNYKKLIHDPEFLGAFFWSKSRPNIVLIKNRLTQKNIQLPKEYNQFIEDIK